MKKAIFPTLLLAIALFFTARASCANKDLIPFLGKWSGNFAVSRILKGPDTDKARKDWSMSGYVMIHASGRSFALHLEGPQETLDTSGTWVYSGNRVTLNPLKIDIDDMGGEALRNPNLPFIPTDAVREAYLKPIVLELTKDKKHLNGLTISVERLIGRLELAKDSF